MVSIEVESSVTFTSLYQQGNPLQAGTEATMVEQHKWGVHCHTSCVSRALSWGSISVDTQLCFTWEAEFTGKIFLNKPKQWNHLSPVLLVVTWGLSQLWWENTLGFSLWCPFPPPHRELLSVGCLCFLHASLPCCFVCSSEKWFCSLVQSTC